MLQKKDTHEMLTVHLIRLPTKRCYEPAFTKTDWATNFEEPSYYIHKNILSEILKTLPNNFFLHLSSLYEQIESAHKLVPIFGT